MSKLGELRIEFDRPDRRYRTGDTVFVLKADIDDDGALRRTDRPYVIVHRHRRVVWIAFDEHAAARTHSLRVEHGERLIDFNITHCTVPSNR